MGKQRGVNGEHSGSLPRVSRGGGAGGGGRGWAGNLPEMLETRALLSAAVVNAVWEGHDVKVVKNQYVVELSPTANLAKLVAESKFTNVQGMGSGFYSLNSKKSVAQMEAWAANHKNKGVVAMTPNVVTRVADLSLPNDPFVGDQWQHRNTGQVVTDPLFDPTGLIAFEFNGPAGRLPGTPGADMKTAQAWTVVTGDPNFADPNKQIVVAVLDTGIDYNHPDLVNEVWSNPREIPGNGIDDDGDGFVDDTRGWDFVNNDNDPLDDNGHGTHVSGIIGAEGNNAVGVSGVIQHVKILPVKVGSAEGFLTTIDIINGIQYITTLKNEGVNIVAANGSFGGLDFPFNRVENDAVSRMGQAGVLFTVAAGNDAANNDPGQDFPGKFVLNQPNVITVAATDNNDNIAFFSNIGAQTVSLAAPGVNILSTFPTYDVGTLLETGEIVASNNPSYGYDSGTSMAAPMVAGAAALLKAARPDASMMEIKNALLAGADQIPALQKPIPAGDPLVTTAGRLNVYRALLNLLNEKTGTDSATRGSWRGAYGRDGSVIYGETGATSTFSNSFVTAQITNATLNVVSDTSTDPDALQSTFNSGTRIASQVTSAGPLTLDLDFSDNKAHRVTLYQADVTGRTPGKQTITLTDPDTGNLINTFTTAALTTGQYTTFQISPGSSAVTGDHSRVRIQIRGSGRQNAVLNGVFFDPAPTASSALVVNAPVAGVTVPGNGDWRRLVGSQGAKVFGTSATTLGPKVTVTGGSVVNNGALTSDPASPVKPRGTSDDQRVAGYLQAKSRMDVRVDLSGQGTGMRKLTVYAADIGNLGRAERLELYNDQTGQLLSSVDVTKFASGKYVSWDVAGGVRYRVRVIRLAGPNAVLGGVFMDAVPGAAVAYEGMDVTSSGNWRTYYGADAAFVFGSSDALVRRNSYTQQVKYGRGNPEPGRSQNIKITFANGGAGVGHVVHTDESRFPLVDTETSGASAGADADRVANPKVTGTAMNLDIKFSDPALHTVAVYMVDPDKDNTRSQRVDLQVYNPATGTFQTVGTQYVTSFSKGKYVVFDARQTRAADPADVRVKVTRVTGQTAVVNAVFFN